MVGLSVEWMDLTCLTGPHWFSLPSETREEIGMTTSLTTGWTGGRDFEEKDRSSLSLCDLAPSLSPASGNPSCLGILRQATNMSLKQLISHCPVESSNCVELIPESNSWLKECLLASTLSVTSISLFLSQTVPIFRSSSCCCFFLLFVRSPGWGLKFHG